MKKPGEYTGGIQAQPQATTFEASAPGPYPTVKGVAPVRLFSKKHQKLEYRIFYSLWRNVSTCAAAACLLMIAIPAAQAQEINVDKMVMAIYKAEGGNHAKKPFGILSVPCETYAACKSVCRKTVRNNITRWDKAGRPGDFISYLQKRYAPIECSPLNKNWANNVRYFYER